jgi:ankyrin repeat protein
VFGQGIFQYLGPLIRTLEHAGIDPFSVNNSRLTPLHYAAGRNMKQVVQVLIVCGADVLARDHHGNTPLHLAAVTGSHQVFEQRVRAGANVNAETRFGWTAADQASISHHLVAVDELERFGSRSPTWQRRRNALDKELLCLSSEFLLRWHHNYTADAPLQL